MANGVSPSSITPSLPMKDNQHCQCQITLQIRKNEKSRSSIQSLMSFINDCILFGSTAISPWLSSTSKRTAPCHTLPVTEVRLTARIRFTVYAFCRDEVGCKTIAANTLNAGPCSWLSQAICSIACIGGFSCRLNSCSWENLRSQTGLVTKSGKRDLNANLVVTRPKGCSFVYRTERQLLTIQLNSYRFLPQRIKAVFKLNTLAALARARTSL